MFVNISETCRTCLSIQPNTIPIMNFTTYSSPISTHADVLRDLAKLKFIAEQECNMPQNICFMCCSQLENMYMFVKQVQECNDKLIRTCVMNTSDNNQKTQATNVTNVVEDGGQIKREHHEDERELKTNFVEVAFKTSKTANEMEDTNFDEVIECEDEYNDIVTASSLDVLEISNDCIDKQCTKGISLNNSISQNVNILENSLSPAEEDYEDDSDSEKDNTNREHSEDMNGTEHTFYTCIYCSRKFDTKCKLEIHLSHKHQIDSEDKAQNNKHTNKLECSFCEYTANTPAALHFHKRSKHGTEDDKIKCKFCSYASLQKFELMMHIKRTHLPLIKALKLKLGKESNIGETSLQEIDPNSQSVDNGTLTDSHSAKVYSDDCSSGDEDIIRNILKMKRRLPKSAEATCRDKKIKLARSGDVIFGPEKQHRFKRQSTNKSPENTTCPLCETELNSRDNLLTHMLLEHREECSSAYIDNSKSSKSKKQLFNCSYCSSKFDNKYEKITHVREQHSSISAASKTKPKYIIEDQIIKCRLCDYTTKTYAGLHYHTRSKHGTEDDKFKCKFCIYSCFKKFDLMHHTKRNHLSIVKTIKQDIAKYKLQRETSEAEMDEHVFPIEDITSLVQKYQNTGDKDNTDNNLDMSSGDEEIIRDILNMKKRVPKSGTSGSFARRCEECGNVYKNSIALNVHRRMVHREHVYSQCEHCERRYKRPYDLKLHILDKHTPKEGEPKPTPKIEREKRFMCTQCSYICSTTTLLTIHTHRHHTGEKPYKCEFCSKAFVVPADLKTHRYLHTGERPFKCPICQKGFRDRNHMQRHKRTHSDLKPYNCAECGKGFSKNYNLTIHQRTHMKGQRLRCLVCGKYFKDRALLNVHQISENHHEEVV